MIKFAAAGSLDYLEKGVKYLEEHAAEVLGFKANIDVLTGLEKTMESFRRIKPQTYEQ
ncbi:MAG: hypothetical protein AABW65_02145 [Nanoarchaeota archaeon]